MTCLITSTLLLRVVLVSVMQLTTVEQGMDKVKRSEIASANTATQTLTDTGNLKQG